MRAQPMTSSIEGLLAIWIAALLVAVGAFAWTGLLSDPCEAKPGDSNYGEVTWSWAPVGHGCKWTREVNGFNRTDGPGLIPSAYVAALVLSGAALAIYERRTRRVIAVTAFVALAAAVAVSSVDWLAGSVSRCPDVSVGAVSVGPRAHPA